MEGVIMVNRSLKPLRRTTERTATSPISVIEESTVAQATYAKLVQDKWVVDDKDGVFKATPNGSKAVCSPVRAIAYLVDQVSGNVSVQFEISSQHVGFDSYANVPMSHFANPNRVVEELLNKGLRVFEMHQTKLFIADCLKFGQPIMTIYLVNKPGWHPIPGDKFKRKAYLRREGLTLPRGTDTLLQLPDNPGYVLGDGCTLFQWQTKVGGLCARNPRLIFSLCSGLAGAILDIVEYTNIGIHHFGPSRCGKTTLLRVAASIFGNSARAGTWSGTKNAFQENAVAHCDGPYILDEISQCGPGVAAYVAYDVMNGTTRSRLSSNGKTQPVDYFRVVLISAGEESFEDVLLKDNKAQIKGGQLIRIISIPANSSDVMYSDLHGHDSHSSFSAALLRNSEKYREVAGSAYVKHLADNQIQLRKTLPDEIQIIEEQVISAIELDSPSAIERDIAKRMAIIAAAGELAIRAGIFPFKAGDAIKAAKYCYRAWYDHELKAAEQREPAFPSLKSFFARTKASALSQENYENSEIVLFWSVVDGTDSLLIQPEYFERTLCSTFGKKAGLNALEKRGLLIRGSGKRPTRQVHVQGLGKCSFVAIRASILTTK